VGNETKRHEEQEIKNKRRRAARLFL